MFGLLVGKESMRSFRSTDVSTGAVGNVYHVWRCWRRGLTSFSGKWPRARPQTSLLWLPSETIFAPGS